MTFSYHDITEFYVFVTNSKGKMIFYAENTAIIKLFNICICYLSPFHEPEYQRLYSPKVQPFILPIRITKTLQN